VVECLIGSHVLPLFLTVVLSWAISWFRSAPVRGALARRRSVGAGTVPPQVSHACGRGRSTLGVVPAGPPETNRARSGIPALPSSHHRHRAGLPVAPPSIDLQLRASQPWATRCWLFDTDGSTPSTSWPASCRPSRLHRCASINRDHRHRVGDDEPGVQTNCDRPGIEPMMVPIVSSPAFSRP
jgi:hypothetical protein